MCIKAGDIEPQQTCGRSREEASVTGLTFAAEDLKSAPVEVRRWFIGRIESELLALASTAPVSAPAAEPVAWPPAGFQPRQLGPSENIAAHR
jgi:hypothetical protein